MDNTSRPLRFGILGAAAIAPRALIWPVQGQAAPGVTVVAVAARDIDRARTFATRHKIPRVHAGYTALLEDPEVDAVYIPLPNALHAEWTIRALEAGKQVLCEKPMASNAAEVERVAEVAAKSGRLLMDALHYRYHPLIERAWQIVASGEIGDIVSIDARLCIPLLALNDIRFHYALGGGATMDLGCYTIDFIRVISGAEPVVTSARALLVNPEVDRAMEAAFTLPDLGATATMRCSLRSANLLSLWARITGSRGVLSIRNPFLPHFGHRIRVQVGKTRRDESVTKEPTYNFQLRAFAAAVRDGGPNPTDAANALALARVIDAVYVASGLKPRGL